MRWVGFCASDGLFQRVQRCDQKYLTHKMLRHKAQYGFSVSVLLVTDVKISNILCRDVSKKCNRSNNFSFRKIMVCSLFLFLLSYNKTMPLWLIWTPVLTGTWSLTGILDFSSCPKNIISLSPHALCTSTAQSLWCLVKDFTQFWS